ncbi:hypothetical protein [Pandoraea iniqua]|uniref:hypothetical protein n=1 Tax=Pandoraea iniqua TaxID=2508288 RepID=UPI001FE94540|nr:hypothetical protein [Pandoraea iniqua]
MALGLLVSLYLKGVTLRLLGDLCGTENRAAFWVRATTIMLIAGPLLLALAFGNSNATITLGEIARRALLMATAGIVVSVSAMAGAIMKSIPIPSQPVIKA